MPINPTQDIKLSVVIITRNEEKKLPDCLRSVSFADEIIVVDSESTDKTREIAENFGAKVITRAFTHYSDQKNFAMNLAQGEWILSIDADEQITPALQTEIQERFKKASNVDGFWIRRMNHIFGSPMRFGASMHDWQLRLVRRNKGRYEGMIHERIQITGSAEKLNAPMEHWTFQNLADYQKRFNLYIKLESEEIFKKEKKPSLLQLCLWPVFQFIYFYFFKLGFLDGKVGLVYQTLSSHYMWAKLKKARELFNLRS